MVCVYPLRFDHNNIGIICFLKFINKLIISFSLFDAAVLLFNWRRGNYYYNQKFQFPLLKLNNRTASSNIENMKKKYNIYKYIHRKRSENLDCSFLAVENHRRSEAIMSFKCPVRAIIILWHSFMTLYLWFFTIRSE